MYKALISWTDIQLYSSIHSPLELLQGTQQEILL